jgi:hypothetical protein
MTEIIHHLFGHENTTVGIAIIITSLVLYCYSLYLVIFKAVPLELRLTLLALLVYLVFIDSLGQHFSIGYVTPAIAILNVIWIYKSITSIGPKHAFKFLADLTASIISNSYVDACVVLFSLASMFATTTGRISHHYSIAVVIVNFLFFIQSFWFLYFAHPGKRKLDLVVFVAEQIISMFVFIIVIVAAFANIYSMYTLSYNNHDVHPNIWTSLYFSIVTWTTLGYGDLSPTEKVRKFASAEVVIGWIALTMLLSGITRAFTRIDNAIRESAPETVDNA